MDNEIFKDSRWLIGAIARGLNATGHAAAASVVERLLAQKLGGRDFQRPRATRLPVLCHLAPCVAEAMLVNAGLAAAIAAVEDHLAWRQSPAYTDQVLGDGFTDNYGWCELIGPNGFFPGDDFLLGLLMLGPNRHYLDHFHPAPELYWPLTSGTDWRQGEGGFTEHEAGTVIWHAPEEVHATRTGGKPLLAVWAWTENTATPARLVAAQ